MPLDLKSDLVSYAKSIGKEQQILEVLHNSIYTDEPIPRISECLGKNVPKRIKHIYNSYSLVFNDSTTNVKPFLHLLHSDEDKYKFVLRAFEDQVWRFVTISFSTFSKVDVACYLREADKPALELLSSINLPRDFYTIQVVVVDYSVDYTDVMSYLNTKGFSAAVAPDISFRLLHSIRYNPLTVLKVDSIDETESCLYLCKSIRQCNKILETHKYAVAFCRETTKFYSKGGNTIGYFGKLNPCEDTHFSYY